MLNSSVLRNIEGSPNRLISLCVNSIPYKFITETQFNKIKGAIKTTYKYMDVAIVTETYTTQENAIKHQHKLSYNIFCDGGRICRPLYVATKYLDLCEKQLLEKGEYNQLINDGYIELVFAIELSSCKIAESTKPYLKFMSLYKSNEPIRKALNTLNDYPIPLQEVLKKLDDFIKSKQFIQDSLQIYLILLQEVLNELQKYLMLTQPPM